MDAFFDAYAALDARMKLIDVITNNLANAQTTGFKRDFSRILETETGLTSVSQVDLSPSDLVNTGNELDAAIDGPGFFAIQTPAGLRYTRAGNFVMSANGDLITNDGMKVLSSSGSAINGSGGTAGIQDGGAVTVDGKEVATLKIVTFPNQSQLRKDGINRFVWAGADGDVQPVPEPRVKGGHLERSNVNSVSEMVHLMSVYREFEGIQRTLRTVTTDMNSKLVQELGRLG
jgi:flagellar basal-body rod protein FlgF